MSNKEQAVSDAAAKLAEAIHEARADGLVVTWPATPDGLASMPISASRRALTPDEIGAAAKAQAEREQGMRVVQSISGEAALSGDVNLKGTSQTPGVPPVGPASAPGEPNVRGATTQPRGAAVKAE